MHKIEKGEEVVIATPLLFVECAHIFEREGHSREKISNQLKVLLDCKGLKTVGLEDRKNCNQAIELFGKYQIDIVDALNILTMRKLNVKEIYSLDSHYDIIKETKRIEPTIR